MARDTYLRGVPATSLSLALLALIFIGFQPKAQAQAVKNEPTNDASASKQHFVEAYGKLPLAFAANTGQTSIQVRFLSRGQGYTLFLTRNAEAVLVLSTSSQKKTSGQSPS